MCRCPGAFPYAIRPLRESDEPAVAELLGSLSPETQETFHPYPLTAASAPGVIRQAPGVSHGAFALDGLLLGYAWFSGPPDALPELGIVVRDSARRRGIGQQLIETLQNLARVAGFTGLRLRVVRSNAVAIRLYERCGFEWTDNHDYQREGRKVESMGMQWLCESGSERCSAPVNRFAGAGEALA